MISLITVKTVPADAAVLVVARVIQYEDVSVLSSGQELIVNLMLMNVIVLLPVLWDSFAGMRKAHIAVSVQMGIAKKMVYAKVKFV